MKPILIAVLLFTAGTILAVAKDSKSPGGAPEIGHRDAAVNLAMGQWRFVAIGKIQVLTIGRQQPYLKFEGHEKRVTGFTGCNRLHGAYRAGKRKLTFQNIAVTRMACPSDRYERRILELLNSVKEYSIIGHELHLLRNDKVLAILIRPHEEQTMQPARESK